MSEVIADAYGVLRNPDGTFAKGTPQPWGFKKGHVPWNKKTFDIQEIISMNERGYTLEEIAKKFGVHWHTLRRFLKENGVKLKIYKPSRRLKPNLQPSPELAYLLGALLGDGCCYDKGSSPFVRLSVKEEIFARKVAESLAKIGLRPRIKRGKDGLWSTTAFSVEFCRWYKSLTYDKIREIATQYPLEFLRGFYEAEGGCYYERGSLYIKIANKQRELLEICKTILSSIGYRSSIIKRTKGKHFWYVLNICGTTKDKKRLLALLNPCIKGVN
ncbi:MAG: LAGLIDADG family homing endonuclease [Candidatus Methanospirareceae archaeon]